MRRTIALLLALTLVPALPAGAQSVADRLDEARRDRATALAEAHRLTARIRSLSQRYRKVEAAAERAADRLMDAYLAEQARHDELAEARTLLDARADAAYRAGGPGAAWEAFLSARSVADFSSAEVFLRAVLRADAEAAARAAASHGRARAAVTVVERERGRLATEEMRLAALHAALEAKLARARALARAAGVRIRGLERERRRLLAAARRDEERRQRSLIGGRGLDQSELLALLGPRGGRGCAIPEGLRATGRAFSGLASWYGWEFAGRPTASGAIFDPRLFTAAHRTLPLNSFLRVRRGERCAIVLVNDRGPFIAGRVLDLSQAAAEYLGVGVTHVGADLLAIE